MKVTVQKKKRANGWIFFVNIKKILCIWLYEDVTIEVFTRKLNRNVIDKGLLYLYKEDAPIFLTRILVWNPQAWSLVYVDTFKSAIKGGKESLNFKVDQTQF